MSTPEAFTRLYDEETPFSLRGLDGEIFCVATYEEAMRALVTDGGYHLTISFDDYRLMISRGPFVPDEHLDLVSKSTLYLLGPSLGDRALTLEPVPTLDDGTIDA